MTLILVRIRSKHNIDIMNKNIAENRIVKNKISVNADYILINQTCKRLKKIKMIIDMKL